MVMAGGDACEWWWINCVIVVVTLSCLMAIAGEGAPCTPWLLRRMKMVQVLSGDSGSFEGSTKGSSGAW